jgi:hypothetical protein
MTLDELLDQHADLVEASAKAWTIMSDAQAVSRACRDAEHKSAEMIEAYLTDQLLTRSPNLNPKFKPVIIEVDLS